MKVVYHKSDIYNRVLSLLKCTHLDYLDTSNPAIAILHSLYPLSKYEVLQEYTWSSALCTSSLYYTKDKNNLHGFKYKFLLPTDFITFISTNVKDYLVRGCCIYANQKNMTVTYIGNIPDEELSIALYSLISYRLAYNTADDFGVIAEYKSSLYNQYMDKLVYYMSKERQYVSSMNNTNLWVNNS